MTGDLNVSEKDALYKHLMNIWDIMPEDIKFRFKREQGCVLCDTHKEYISDVQKQIKADKAMKALQMSANNEENKNLI